MFATGETVGLAEWIIDDTCLVICLVYRNSWRFCCFSVHGVAYFLLHAHVLLFEDVTLKTEDENTHPLTTFGKDFKAKVP